MSGMLVPVIGMTTYDFGNLAASQNIAIDVAQNIDVTQHQSATLLVRVHTETVGTDAEIKVSAYSVLPSAQDPSKVFRVAAALGTATIDDATMAPTLLIAPLSEPLGAFLTIVVEGTQAPTPTTVAATISVELSLTNCVDGGAQ